MAIIGLLSDPHGDARAFAAGLDLLEAAGCDEIWCLGDLVGAPAPRDTIRLAQDRCDIVVAGNHDLLAVERLAESYLDSHGADGVRWVRAQLSPEDINYLRALPISARGGQLEAVHAAIDHPTDHVVDVLDADNQLALADAPFLALGHSHRGLCFTADGRWIVEPTGEIDVGASAVVSPGSVRASTVRAGTVCVLDVNGRVCRWLTVGKSATDAPRPEHTLVPRQATAMSATARLVPNQ